MNMDFVVDVVLDFYVEKPAVVILRYWKRTCSAQRFREEARQIIMFDNWHVIKFLDPLNISTSNKISNVFSIWKELKSMHETGTRFNLIRNGIEKNGSAGRSPKSGSLSAPKIGRESRSIYFLDHQLNTPHETRFALPHLQQTFAFHIASHFCQPSFIFAFHNLQDHRKNSQKDRDKEIFHPERFGKYCLSFTVAAN